MAIEDPGYLSARRFFRVTGKADSNSVRLMVEQLVRFPQFAWFMSRRLISFLTGAILIFAAPIGTPEQKQTGALILEDYDR